MTRTRLGRKLYAVVRVDAEDMPHYGECDYGERVIRIRKGQALEEMIDTLLHEGLHAQEPGWSEAKVKRRATQLTALVVEALTK